MAKHRYAFKRSATPETPRQEGFVFGGARTVFEALKATLATEVMLTEAAAGRSEVKAILDLAAKQKLPRTYVTMDILDRLLGDGQHQGLACRVRQLPQMELKDLFDVDPHGAAGARNILALDQVQDPMNLGAIVRSANAFGIRAVICPKDNSAPMTQVAVKASAGAALHTPVIYVTNMARTLELLKENHYWVVALEGEASQPITKVDPGSPWVLVAGSEGKGIRPLVAKSADFRIHIPMLGQIESFNVSVACGIALYQLTLSRASTGK